MTKEAHLMEVRLTFVDQFTSRDLVDPAEGLDADPNDGEVLAEKGNATTDHPVVAMPISPCEVGSSSK